MMNLMRKSKQQGFTLIELMIVVAIIAILAAIAIPAFLSYIMRARSAEMVNFAMALKTPIAMCLLGRYSDCSAGSNGVPANPTAPAGKYTDTVVTTYTDPTATITVTGDATLLNGLTYILHGELNADGTVVEWTVDPASTCITGNVCPPA
jgi:type IV pilus assembly protein PilA